MEKKLRGKYLIRKSKMSDGTPVLMLVGTFFPPTDWDVESNFKHDEMWVSDVIIGDGGLRFQQPKNHFSPEEFLENDDYQAPNQFKIKSNIDNVDFTKF